MARLTRGDRLTALERVAPPRVDGPRLTDLPHGPILARLAGRLRDLVGATDERSRTLAALYAAQADALMPGARPTPPGALAAVVGHVRRTSAALGLPDDEDWLHAVGVPPVPPPTLTPPTSEPEHVARETTDTEAEMQRTWRAMEQAIRR